MTRRHLQNQGGRLAERKRRGGKKERLCQTSVELEAPLGMRQGKTNGSRRPFGSGRQTS